MRWTTALIGRTRVRLKIATTPSDQYQGYRGASTIGAAEGILFADLEPGATFTMQETHMPLAIAWLSDHHKVLAAQLIQPRQVWIPAPVGARHALECHPDHLPDLQAGRFRIEVSRPRLAAEN